MCMYYVDSKPVEFVKSYPHLGHIINARMDDTEDISHTRGAFIGQVNNALCYFNTPNSHTKYRLFQLNRKRREATVYRIGKVDSIMAPLREGTSPEKCSGMARIVCGSHSFNCHSYIYPQLE